MKCEALDNNRVWRPARITQLTRKGDNYPNGGAYIQWLDVDPFDYSKSQTAWQPMHCLRNYGDLSNIPAANY